MSAHPINPFPVRAPRLPVSEQLAAALQKTAGSLTMVPHGTIMRNGYGLWDMANEWRGGPILAWQMRYSQWFKGTAIRFYALPLTAQQKEPVFTLHLQDKLTPEEFAQIAETYMAVFNMRRVT